MRSLDRTEKTTSRFGLSFHRARLIITAFLCIWIVAQVAVTPTDRPADRLTLSLAAIVALSALAEMTRRSSDHSRTQLERIAETLERGADDRREIAATLERIDASLSAKPEAAEPDARLHQAKPQTEEDKRAA
jgi:hypothetical protein